MRREAEASSTAEALGEGLSDTAERLELQRVALDALTHIREPYRTTIVERYLDGRSAVEIADRQGVPAKTVHTRLRRGMALLREELERRGARDGHDWLAGLAVLAPRSSSTALPAGGAATSTTTGAATAAGVLLMGTGTKLMLSAAGAAALAGGWWALDRGPAGPAADLGRAAEGSERLAPAGPVALTPEAPTDSRRSLSAQGNTAPEVMADEVPAPRRRRGLVVDHEGTPLPRLAFDVELDAGGTTRFQSDISGAFELDLETEGRVVAAAPDRVLLLEPTLSAERPADLRLTAVPAVRLRGLVVGDDALPVPGAEVEVQVLDGLVMRSSTGQVSETERDNAVRTDDAGVFELLKVPSIARARMRVTAAGYVPWIGPVPANDDLAMTVSLERAQGGPSFVNGRVVDETGSGLAGAWVEAGGGGVETDAEGRFAAPLETYGDAPAEVTVRAVASGRQPAERTIPRGSTTDVVLELTGQALAISGQVVDARGRPVPDAEVWLGGRKRFGSIPRRAGSLTIMMTTEVEDLMSPEGAPIGPHRTNAEGAFVIDGLRSTDYTLHAMDREALGLATLRDVPAGSSGLRVELPEGTPRRVSGRVVDRTGTPLPGAKVNLKLADGAPEIYSSLGPRTTADENGAFSFEGVLAGSCILSASASNVFAQQEFPLASDDKWDGLEIVVARELRARFRTQDPRFRDAHLTLHDEGGESLEITVQSGSVALMGHGTMLEEGESGLVLFDERALTLRLTRDDGETRTMRVPEVDAGGLTVVDIE